MKKVKIKYLKGRYKGQVLECYETETDSLIKDGKAIIYKEEKQAIQTKENKFVKDKK